MAFEKVTENLEGLSENTQEYVKISTDHFKLSLFNQAMKAALEGVKLVTRSMIFLICFLFFSIGAAVLISDYMGSASMGYFIVGGCYLVFFLLLYAFGKKPLEKFFLRKYSKIFFADESPLDIK